MPAMPELPEVESVVRTWSARLVARRIGVFESRWPRQASPSAAAVRRGIVGRAIERVWRRGKYIVMDLEGGGHLLIHLRMSGRLEAAAAGASEPRHTRAVFELDDGLRLHFCDARKFGRIVLCGDVERGTGGLGVEPLSAAFSAARLGKLLAGRRRQLKPLLLDQRVIAGLGNIYTDEALFRAGIHPLEPSDRIDGARVKRLHAAIRAVLKDGIRRNGASIDWVYPGGRMQDFFRVYGREGEACVTCGTTIAYLRVAQRGTHVCPRCQRRGAGECGIEGFGDSGLSVHAARKRSKMS